MSGRQRPREVFECSVCQAHCGTEESLAAHLRGRAHQRALDKKREAARNVFVRGFPKHSTVNSDLLKELFQQYGAVESVFLKDVYAIVTFKCEASAVSALQSPPLMGEKRLVVKPREYKPHLRARVAAMNVFKPRCSLPVTQETIELLRRVETLTEQVLLLSAHSGMSDHTVTHIISLRQHLYCRLSTIYPNSVLIPFGSFISGHGTTTSDCDLSFLTHLDHPHLFTPEVYYPPTVLQLVHHPPPSPTTSFSNSSTHSTPERQIKLWQEDDHNLRAIADVLRGVSGCERVFVIESARCPIVRFYHSPSKLHVDLSINNILGPHNSRLMRAYSEFDSRVIPLIRVVRLWMRNVTQRQVNSYAVSLMVIHSLQHTTPPLLPCLQDLGPWPRNMEWFKQCHSPSDNVMCGPWSCDFVTTASLMPSSCTDSVDTLLIHFFRYYSTQFPFQRQIVTIHRTAPVSLEEANKLLECPLQTNSPLVVQDPFDHSHNVCKSLSASSFTFLAARLAEALHILSSRSAPLLEIFTEQVPQGRQHQQGKTIALSMEHVIGLLRKREGPLADVLSELDLTNHITQNSLFCVIAQCVVDLMKEKFGFLCEPVEGHVPQYGDTVTPEESTTSEDGTRPEDQMATLPDHMTALQTHSLPNFPSLVTVRKRRRSSSSSSDENKRTKRDTEGHSPLDLLRSVVAILPQTTSYHCKAYENTWVGSRQRRRGKMKGLLASLPTPVESMLEVILSVVPPNLPEVTKISKKTTVCVMCVHPLSPHHKVHCEQWFSVFKPLVVSA